MKRSFYRSPRLVPIWLASSLLLGLAACAPRYAKIDDAKLAGVPAERLTGVNDARQQLAAAKVELAKAQDGVAEAVLRLKIRRAALDVAAAKVGQSEAEFALAKFQNNNEALVKAGDGQRADELGVRRAAADVEVSRAELTLAQRAAAAAEKNQQWLEVKLEHERAKVALRYDDGTANQKSAQLSEYERASLEAQLAWKDADTRAKQAAVDLDNAKALRAALDTVK